MRVPELDHRDLIAPGHIKLNGTHVNRGTVFLRVGL
jgi:ribosomal protein S4